MNTGWPVQRWPQPYAEYLQYDWYSGLWEFSDEATVRFGSAGCGFGTWAHVFHEPADVT